MWWYASTPSWGVRTSLCLAVVCPCMHACICIVHVGLKEQVRNERQVYELWKMLDFERGDSFSSWTCPPPSSIFFSFLSFCVSEEDEEETREGFA